MFEPKDQRIVIGRSQDPNRECVVAHCQQDGVPIHRRATGGGAVILAPGMLVMAIRMPRDVVGTDCYFDRVNQVIRPVIQHHAGQEIRCCGHGDLALVDEIDGTKAYAKSSVPLCASISSGWPIWAC